MPYQANRLITLPTAPLLAKSISAVPPVSRAPAEFCGMPEEELVEVPVDDPAEPFVALDDEAADEPEELDELEELGEPELLAVL